MLNLILSFEEANHKQGEEKKYIDFLLLISDIYHVKESIPMVGMDGGNLSLYKIVVLPAAYRPNHKNTHLFLGKQPAEKLGERQPHSCN